MCLRVCGGGMPPSTEKDTQKYVEKNIFFIHSWNARPAVLGGIDCLFFFKKILFLVVFVESHLQ